MDWFRQVGAAPDTEGRSRVASVRRTTDGKTAGAAVALGGDAMLTCAHVVNDALGRALFETRPPGLDPLFVEVQGARKTERYPARVAHWIAPRTREGTAVRDGDGEWLGDLAVLRVDAPPVGMPAADRRTAMVPGQQVRAWHGSGHSATFADLRVAALDGSVGYLDGKATGMAVGPGYSGGPLWCEEDGAVVGLLAAHFMPPCDSGGAPLPHSPQHMVRRSWAIPWQQVEAELRPLGVLAEEGAEPADPDDPAFGMLVTAIGNALPSPYSLGDTARQLALACGVAQGSPVSPPPSRSSRRSCSAIAAPWPPSPRSCAPGTRWRPTACWSPADCRRLRCCSHRANTVASTNSCATSTGRCSTGSPRRCARPPSGSPP